MAFTIQHNERYYTIEGFIVAQHREPYAVNAAFFLQRWTNDEPFTFYTSGSTGRPRALQFTRRQLQSSAQLTINALALTSKDHILLCLDPKFVGGAMMIARALELDCMLTIVKPSMHVLNGLEADHPFTFASFVPSQLLHDDFDVAKYDRFGQVLIGGSGIPAALEQQLAQRRAVSFHTYGMTETLSHVALRRIGYEPYFKALPGVQVMLNDEGCICIKPPFINEWINTHDVVEFIDDIHFKVLGRTDFVINSGGIKIYPEALERAMEETIDRLGLGKKGFIISGVADKILGEKCVCVFAAPVNAEQFNLLVEMLRELVPAYIIPRGMYVISEWPVTGNGKIDRKAVIELIHNQAF